MKDLPTTLLLDLDNKEVQLKDMIQSDKFNLILFYNSNCLGCTGRALPFAYDLITEYDFISLLVIHSNFRKEKFSTEEILSVFVNQQSPFPIYREEYHDLFDFFQCEGTPHWIVLDDKGNQINSIFGSQDGAQMKLHYAIQEYESKIKN